MKLRTRIFVGTTGLVLGVTALSWLLSAAFLGPFYAARKRIELGRIARAIGPLPQASELGKLYDRFAVLEQSSSVHITVASRDGRVLYDSALAAYTIIVSDASKGGQALAPPPPPPGPPSFPPFMIPGLGPQFGGRNSTGGAELYDRIGSAEPTFVESLDPHLDVRFLFLLQRQSSGLLLALSFPLAEVQESARLAALFSVLSGLAALAMGGLFSFVFAKSVTRPLVQLNAQSRSLARLDFSHRFVSARRDEVAELGLTMNELSESLAKALAELEATNARLREDVEHEKRIDAMRREFISSVSHELKTPIALILGYTEGLIEGVPTDREAEQSYLAIIADEARKMDMQVRDLLELSQLESGLLPLKTETFDLGDLAAEVLASFAPTLSERAVEPRLRRPPSPPLVNADRPKIRRAIVNYLTNALAHLDDLRRIDLDIEARDGWTGFELFNSGEPIPEEALELIWNSYYRIDSARSRHFGGTGLGLAIVKGIADRHGGRCEVRNLEAEADRPRGVCFSFWLPSVGGRGTEA